MDEPPPTPPRLLLIDNYDSYTYNLLQSIAVVTGAVPDVVRNHDERLLDVGFLREFAGVVVGPGPGHPGVAVDVGHVKKVVQELYEGPILGVCLGFQALGLWNGCQVVKAKSAIHGEISPVDVVKRDDPLFREIPVRFGVVRYHSLVIEGESPEVEILAVTMEDEGSRTVPMAVKITGKPHWGVQYHPESICTEYGDQLMANFAAICNVEMPGWKLREGFHQPTIGHLPRRAKAVWTSTHQTVKNDMFKDRMSMPPRVFSTLYPAHQQNTVWLDSSDPRGRYSIMGDASGPYDVIFKHKISPGDPTDTTHLDEIEQKISNVKTIDGIDESTTHPTAPFQGGCLGYIGYEMRGECLHHSHDISEVDIGPEDGLSTTMPDLFMVYTQRWVVIDHDVGEVIIGSVRKEGDREGDWVSMCVEKIRKIISSAEGCGAAEIEAPVKVVDPIVFTPHQDKTQYIASIRKCKELILEGETYEVCLTNEFTADGGIRGKDTFDFYNKLRVINPAPYAGYIGVAGCGVVASSSPERFLKINKGNEAEAKPIKGTIKRDLDDPEEDERLRVELKNSKKDQCENLMIVDLLRNDLGMLSTPGRVTVPSLMQIESYKTVHQMVTTVRAHLPPTTPHTTVVKNTFPGGSIVGAPKVRTMSIIRELENRRRGIYTGSLGYFSLTGCSDLNIAIRTAVVTRLEKTGEPVLKLGAGGAITIQSTDEGEWDEIMIKAYPLMRAVSRIVTGEEGSYKVAGVY